MAAKEFSIEGMMCQGCVTRVTNLLKKVPGVGVEDVQIGTARVTIEEGGETAIVETLEKAGYKAALKN